MKRIIIVLTCIFLSSFCIVNGQDIQNGIVDSKIEKSNKRKYRALEYELMIGASIPLKKAPIKEPDDTQKTLQWELRYNFARMPIDIGIGSKFILDHVTYQSSIYVLGDYNFIKSKIIKIFTGIGLGYGTTYDFNAYIGSPELEIKQKYTPIGQHNILISPKAGIEVYDHIRLSVYGNFTQKYFNNIGIGVGIVLGGGYKK